MATRSAIALLPFAFGSLLLYCYVHTPLLYEMDLSRLGDSNECMRRVESLSLDLAMQLRACDIIIATNESVAMHVFASSPTRPVVEDMWPGMEVYAYVPTRSRIRSRGDGVRG